MPVAKCAVIAIAASMAVGAAAAGEVSVAVAANFTEVIEVLAADFEAASGHEVRISTGSTGQLYAQISNGAPFDLFLAADQATPERLEADGGIAEGSRFTYAVGIIALWSADPDLIADGEGARFLEDGDFRALAIANPDVAPYGAAARAVMMNLDVWGDLQDRIVRGENIGQTYALVSTGNAEAGFVALSYVLSPENEEPGSRWDIPQALYPPIRQDAVITMRGADNDAAADFVAFLKSDNARGVIRAYGYGVE